MTRELQRLRAEKAPPGPRGKMGAPGQPGRTGPPGQGLPVHHVNIKLPRITLTMQIDLELTGAHLCRAHKDCRGQLVYLGRPESGDRQAHLAALERGVIYSTTTVVALILRH